MSHSPSITKQQLQIVEERIAEYDDKIKSFREQIDSISRERERYVEEGRKLADVLAPVSRVPFDVLSRIFEFCMPEPGSHNWWEDVEGQCMPTILSQVNRQFRQVAIRTASLWTAIDIRDQPLTPRNELFLSRSKGHLLDIHILDMRVDETDVDLPSLLSSLPAPSQWRSFSIDNHALWIPFWDMREGLKDLGGAPHLEKLQIAGPPFPIAMMGVERPDMKGLFGDTVPRLSSLTIYDFACRWSPSLFYNLLTLNLTISSPEEHEQFSRYLLLIQLVKRLERLVFMGSMKTHIYNLKGLPSVESGTRVSFVLEFLRDLHIGGLMPESLMMFLSSISTPNVERLTLDSWHLPGYHLWAGPLDMITSTRFPALQSLKLEDVDMLDFATFGMQLPAVTEIELISSERLLEHYCSIQRERKPNMGQEGARGFPERGWHEELYEDQEAVSPVSFSALTCVRALGRDYAESVLGFVRCRRDEGIDLRSVLFDWHEDDKGSRTLIKKLRQFVQVGFFDSKRSRFHDQSDDEGFEDESESEWDSETSE